MITARINYITESGWEGHVSDTLTWKAETEEELFQKMLKKNHELQRQFRSYEFADYDLLDKYDEWWANLSDEEKAKIQGIE